MKEDNGDSAEQPVENGESGGENGTDDSSKHINHSTPTPPSEQSQPEEQEEESNKSESEEPEPITVEEADNREGHIKATTNNETSETEEMGLSNEMCPESEVAFRVLHQLIHKIEEGKFMVKEYQRPAADKTDHSAPANLRTKAALSKTVHYLLSSVVRSEFSFADKYSFIANRLRAVRQELTIQRLSGTWFGVKLLIGCCNFYLVSRRIFADFKTEENFIDLPKFNENHLKECIATIISFLAGLDNDELFGIEIGTTREAIAILLLSSFNNLTAANIVLHFVFSKMNELKSHQIVLNPLSLFRSFYHKNWTQFSRAFHRLSRIQQITVEPHVSTIRKYTLQSCVLAYHNQRLPLGVLAGWLIQSKQETSDLISESAGLETKQAQDGAVEVQFNKKEFDIDSVPVDVLSTRAAGALSQQVLFDMCQVADYEQELHVVNEVNEKLDKIDIDTDGEYETEENYNITTTNTIPMHTEPSVSINPLDVAASASSDEDSIPIWMRPKAKVNNRNHNRNRQQNRARHNSNNGPPGNNQQGDRRQRKSSHRSRERDNRPRHHQEPGMGPPGRGDKEHERKRRERKYANGGGGSGQQGGGDMGGGGGGGAGRSQSNRGGKKPGSTASRSWQHDDRTRTSY